MPRKERMSTRLKLANRLLKSLANSATKDTHRATDHYTVMVHEVEDAQAAAAAAHLEVKAAAAEQEKLEAAAAVLEEV